MANGHRFSAFWLRSSVSEDFNKVFFCGFFYPWFFGLDFYTFFLLVFFIFIGVCAVWTTCSLPGLALVCLWLCLGLAWFLSVGSCSSLDLGF